MEIFKIIKRDVKLLLVNIHNSILYFLQRNRTPLKSIKKIVFVCKGNICRSAFAEYHMKSVSNHPDLTIESCGIDGGTRMPSPVEAKVAAKIFGLDMDGHLSKGLQECDIENADLILPMEWWQYKRMIEIFPHKRNNIRVLMEYAPFPRNLLCNISDPFGQSLKKFEKCFFQIKRAVDGLNLKQIRFKE